MDLEEINSKWESYKRTEKALDDEYDAHLQKSKKFHYEMMDFIRNRVREGYVCTLNGWKKDE